MRYRSRAFLAGLLGFTVAFVVACGSGNGLLSTDQASNLNHQLSSISAAVAAGDCSGATAAAQQLSNEVGALGSNVNTVLIENLGQGAATVSALATRDCSRSTTTTTTTTTRTTSSPTTTPTTTTTSTPTTTTPTTTSPTGTATNPGGTGTTSNGGAGLTTGAGAGGAGSGAAGAGGTGGVGGGAAPGGGNSNG
jgi:hypothetical protein